MKKTHFPSIFQAISLFHRRAISSKTKDFTNVHTIKKIYRRLHFKRHFAGFIDIHVNILGNRMEKTKPVVIT